MTHIDQLRRLRDSAKAAVEASQDYRIMMKLTDLLNELDGGKPSGASTVPSSTERSAPPAMSSEAAAKQQSSEPADSGDWRDGRFRTSPPSQDPSGIADGDVETEVTSDQPKSDANGADTSGQRFAKPVTVEYNRS